MWFGVFSVGERVDGCEPDEGDAELPRGLHAGTKRAALRQDLRFGREVTQLFMVSFFLWLMYIYIYIYSGRLVPGTWYMFCCVDNPLSRWLLSVFILSVLSVERGGR